MQRIGELIRKRAEELLADGTVSAVIGWKKGEFFYDETPAVFRSAAELGDFVYDGFSAPNLSKYLIKAAGESGGKILALLKPCDTYSFNQLVKEHRVDREKVYALGVECRGMLDIEKIRSLGIRGILGAEERGGELLVHTLYGEQCCRPEDVLPEKCAYCKSKTHALCDELLVTGDTPPEGKNRFEAVERLEAMTLDERFAFWQGELSRCIRCNACRNVCPACTCLQCVFDNERSGVASKANSDRFEEKLYHIIRAFHVAGRCTDCGECSRVCPQHIPLHLLNRKHIKDINAFYGAYQAGADTESGSPLTAYAEGDRDPCAVDRKGGSC